MIKRATLILLFLSFALSQSWAKSLEVYFHQGAFYSPGNGTYIETYLAINGKSIHYVKNKNNNYQGSIEITLLFNRDTVIEQFDKYIITSPEVKDTNNIDFNIIDLKRKQLRKGTYEIMVKIVDVNNPSNKATISEPVILDHDKKKVQLSDIQLVESYKKTEVQNILSKSGYDLVPFVTNFYPNNSNKLIFYAEVYNTPSVLNGNEFLVTASIRKKSNGNIAGGFSLFFKQEAQPVNPMFSEFDISTLPSGNYYLVIEVKNKNNELLIRKSQFFQRSNQKVAANMDKIDDATVQNSFVANFTEDQIRYCLEVLEPIASGAEFKLINKYLEEGDPEMMKRYFLNFWIKRNPSEPYQEWVEYGKAVEAVNQSFSTRIYQGYETDRGRVYLSNGPPDRILKEDKSPNSIPYQIWHYYAMKDGQRDIKFVFANQDLVSNNYHLIHSNAIGEVKDPRWKNIIFYENEGDLNNSDPFNRNNINTPIIGDR